MSQPNVSAEKLRIAAAERRDRLIKQSAPAPGQLRYGAHDDVCRAFTVRVPAEVYSSLQDLCARDPGKPSLNQLVGRWITEALNQGDP